MALEWEAIRYEAKHKTGTVEVLKGANGWFIAVYDKDKKLSVLNGEAFGTPEEAMSGAMTVVKATRSDT